MTANFTCQNHYFSNYMKKQGTITISDDQIVGIASYVIGTDTIKNDKQKFEEIKTIKEETKEVNQYFHDIHEEFMRVQQCRKDANNLVKATMKSREDEDKKLFEQKTDEITTRISEIQKNHLNTVRNIQLNTISLLNEAQEFEIEMIKQLKSQ